MKKTVIEIHLPDDVYLISKEMEPGRTINWVTTDCKTIFNLSKQTDDEKTRQGDGDFSLHISTRSAMERQMYLLGDIKCGVFRAEI